MFPFLSIPNKKMNLPEGRFVNISGVYFENCAPTWRNENESRFYPKHG